METQVIICLAIFVLSLISYGLNKWNMAVTAMVTMMILIVTGCLAPNTAISKFGDSNAIILAAMFIVAHGFGRTQLVDKVAEWVNRAAKGSFDRALTLMLLAVWVLTPFTGSPMTKMVIFYPILTAICEKNNVSPSKAMFPLGLVCLLGGTGIPIGNGAVAHLRFNGFLESYGMPEYSFVMTDIFRSKVLPAIIITIYAIFFAKRLAPNQPVVPIAGMENRGKKKEPLPPFQEKCGYIIFIAVSVGLIFAEKLGIPQWVITVLGAVMMYATGVLKGREVKQALPLDIYLLLVGALSMGSALVETGAGDVIGNAIVTIIGGNTNPFFVNAIFFLVPFIMTQFMNNGATQNIIVPIVILACKSLGCSPLGPIMLVANACMAAFLTPMATSSIPIMMAAGGYDIKSLFKQGWLPAIIYGVLQIVWVTLMFPLWP